MDQGLGPERFRWPAEGTVGPGGQRQSSQGTRLLINVWCQCFGKFRVSLINFHHAFFFLPRLSQVKKAYQGRVTLPGYNENRYNASLALTGLRSSDSGLYRCEVVVGLNDEQDTVPLEVTGNCKRANQIPSLILTQPRGGKCHASLERAESYTVYVSDAERRTK